MFKIKFILLFLILHCFFYPQYSFLTWEEKNTKVYELQKHFDWIDYDVFYWINSLSKQFEIDKVLVCSLIQYESRGRNIRCYQQNFNNTYDHGYMQINDVHIPTGQTSQYLYEPRVNFRIGINYLSFCLRRANNDYMTALRMYNQGHNGNANRYKNWIYVAKILNKYIKTKEKINENKI